MVKVRRSRWLAGLTAIMVLVLPSLGSASGPNLVANGSFEAPALPAHTWSVFQSIPGWQTTTGCGIEVQNRVAGSPLDGVQHVELDSYCPTAMEQVVPTVAGAVYRLRFGYSPRPGVDDNRVRVFWGGQQLAELNRSGVGLSNTRWEYLTFTVMGTGGPVSLAFADAGHPNSLGGYIDDVSLTIDYRQVGIMVKPGDDPDSDKPINLKAKGVIPVAILSSDSFDAATVDSASVRFGPDGAAAMKAGTLADVDSDGDLDLVLHFRSQETGIASGDTEACLSGVAGGITVKGCDSIRTVPE